MLTKKEQTIQKIDMASSYCTSFLCILLGKLVEVQDFMTAITILLGLLIGLVRLWLDLREWYKGSWLKKYFDNHKKS